MLEVLLLVFFRIIFFVMFSPVIGAKNFPAMLKVALAIFLTVISVSTINLSMLSSFSWDITFFLLLLQEMMLGFVMGFLSQMIFVGIEVAGQLIDFQVGFSMAQAYDTTFQINGSQFGKMYYWLATSVFFLTNLHHQLIKGIVGSFVIVPIGTVHFSGITIEGIIKIFSQMIEMAINLSAPIVISLLVIDLILGILSRTVPQINLLLMSLPLKTGISICLSIVLLPNIVTFLSKILPSSISYMNELTHSF